MQTPEEVAVMPQLLERGCVIALGEMVGSDEIMASTFSLGTYPGPTEAMLAREASIRLSSDIPAATIGYYLESQPYLATQC